MHPPSPTPSLLFWTRRKQVRQLTTLILITIDTYKYIYIATHNSLHTPLPSFLHPLNFLPPQPKTAHHHHHRTTTAPPPSTMSKCSCDKEKGPKRFRRLRRPCAFLLVFFFIVLVVFLLIWAILQPKKPRFIIQEATLYSFNVTSTPNLLTSNFQVTISSRNPNDKIGIYYDKLDVYASHRSQQITYYTAIPPIYQGHKTVNTWSPFVTGTNVPISPFNGEALSEDQANGAILLMIKINGRVR